MNLFGTVPSTSTPPITILFCDSLESFFHAFINRSSLDFVASKVASCVSTIESDSVVVSSISPLFTSHVCGKGGFSGGNPNVYMTVGSVCPNSSILVDLAQSSVDLSWTIPIIGTLMSLSM